MLSPNTQRNIIFPAKCMNPPCMNMDEKMVTHVASGVSMLRVTPCSVTMVE